METLTPDRVTACLVTRNAEEANLEEILETLPYGEIIVWDNSVMPDFKVFGRYVATSAATNDVVYFQDDDCIQRNHDALLAAYVPGELTAVYGHGEDPDGYEDIAIFPGGAIVDKALIKDPFERYFAKFGPEYTRGTLNYCDYIFGALVPHVQIKLPFEIRELAYNGQRLADEVWARAEKFQTASQARSLR